MYKKFVIALVLVAHVALPSSAQVQFRGACPTPNPVAAFSPDIADKFIGKSPWSEIRRYPCWYQPTGSTCVQWAYTKTSRTTMSATMTLKNLYGQAQQAQASLAQRNPTANTADYSFVLINQGVPVRGTYNYKILAFNETAGYAIAWSCQNKIFFNKQLLWVLTESPTPKVETITAALAEVTAVGLDATRLQVVSPANC